MSRIPFSFFRRENFASVTERSFSESFEREAGINHVAFIHVESRSKSKVRFITKYGGNKRDSKTASERTSRRPLRWIVRRSSSLDLCTRTCNYSMCGQTIDVEIWRLHSCHARGIKRLLINAHRSVPRIETGALCIRSVLISAIPTLFSYHACHVRNKVVPCKTLESG